MPPKAVKQEPQAGDKGKQAQTANQVFKKFTHWVFLLLRVVGAAAPVY